MHSGKTRRWIHGTLKILVEQMMATLNLDWTSSGAEDITPPNWIPLLLTASSQVKNSQCLNILERPWAALKPEDVCQYLSLHYQVFLLILWKIDTENCMWNPYQKTSCIVFDTEEFKRYECKFQEASHGDACVQFSKWSADDVLNQPCPMSCTAWCTTYATGHRWYNLQIWQQCISSTLSIVDQNTLFHITCSTHKCKIIHQHHQFDIYIATATQKNGMDKTWSLLLLLEL